MPLRSTVINGYFSLKASSTRPFDSSDECATTSLPSCRAAATILSQSAAGSAAGFAAGAAVGAPVLDVAVVGCAGAPAGAVVDFGAAVGGATTAVGAGGVGAHAATHTHTDASTTAAYRDLSPSMRMSRSPL